MIIAGVICLELALFGLLLLKISYLERIKRNINVANVFD